MNALRYLVFLSSPLSAPLPFSPSSGRYLPMFMWMWSHSLLYCVYVCMLVCFCGSTYLLVYIYLTVYLSLSIYLPVYLIIYLSIYLCYLSLPVAGRSKRVSQYTYLEQVIYSLLGRPVVEVVELAN